MRIAILAPHIFMHRDILPGVIFSPGFLAIDLVKYLISAGQKVTFFSPGYDIPGAKNVHPDMSNFEKELKMRGYGYIELLKKHPLTFISLARQVQAELVSRAYDSGNKGEFDIIHSYMNEEETAMAFANLCKTPSVFTHHEPFNFLPKYRSAFAKYKDLNWISISYSQRKTMPEKANFVGNVYHGLPKEKFKFVATPKGDYFAYFGRIIEPKGVHLAIKAAIKAGVNLKIAGKHYAGSGKDKYWEEKISPYLNDKFQMTNDNSRNINTKNKKLKIKRNFHIEYMGFLKTDEEKQDFLGNARGLLMPSTWEEPFGLVMIESLACGTPVIGLNSGAIPEVIKDGETGFLCQKSKVKSQRLKKFTNARIHNAQFTRIRKEGADLDEKFIVDCLVDRVKSIDQIDRKRCRKDFEKRFTLEKMGKGYEEVYRYVIHNA